MKLSGSRDESERIKNQNVEAEVRLRHISFPADFEHLFSSRFAFLQATPVLSPALNRGIARHWVRSRKMQSLERPPILGPSNLDLLLNFPVRQSIVVS